LLQGEDVRQAFIEGTKDANHKASPLVSLLSCHPWLDDNGDAIGHSPEFLEQHPQKSEGDEGWLAGSMKIGLPGEPPSVGESAPHPLFFKDCYDRNGGASILGYPIDRVHRWGDGYIQHFKGGEGYEGDIMQPDGVNYAYAVYGSIWSKYLTLGGSEGPLGYPFSDEASLPLSPISGAKCRYNKFYEGALVHHASGPKAGLTIFLGHGIFNKWEELNYGESALGLPTSDEREVTLSGAEGFNTTGVICDFEGGHIYWHRVGEYKDKGFETHGAIDCVYQKEGGTGGWLGFPISDEYKDTKTGYARSDFEGGYITTTEGINYQAFHYVLPTGKIAFVSDRDGNLEIYLMNTDGTNQIDLTNNPANDWDPVWSPDGKKIAFVSDREGVNKIYIMNANGSDVRALTEGEDPHWFPDGSKIIFVYLS
jgi:hypothetical protein